MIAELGHPRPLDTLVIDGVLWPLRFQNGQIGYIKENTFIPIDENNLVRQKKDLAGRPTWVLRKTPATPVLEKSFKVDLSYEREATVSQTARAKNAEAAKNRVIRWYASSRRLQFSQVFTYFKSHPLAITVTEL